MDGSIAKLPIRDASRWSADDARAWVARFAPVVGVNYVPRTAVNATEMWQAATFDAGTIAQELGWAQALGYRSLRVFLSFAAWQEEPEGSLDRFEQVLRAAERTGMSLLPVPFDDVCFSRKQPYAGPQDAPAEGVHNSAWVPSPGHRIVEDPGRWREARLYLEQLIGRFAQEPAILGWDLFNEPGNYGLGERSLPFMDAVFDWARLCGPSQPLTIGVWAGHNGEFTESMVELALARSDLVTFHAYGPPAAVTTIVERLRAAAGDRPILCTEWLHRPRGNTFAAILPIFERAGIGSYHWGLVAGRTQTNLLWDHDKGEVEGEFWLADVLRPDGTPYDQGEMDDLSRHLARVGAGG